MRALVNALRWVVKITVWTVGVIVCAAVLFTAAVLWMGGMA